MIGTIILFSLPLLVAILDFFSFLFSGKSIVNRGLYKVSEFFSMILIPAIGLGYFGKTNECCSDSAIFSPEHQVTIYSFIILCVVVYFYCSYRNKIAPPLVEIIVNAVLLICIGLNVFIAIQVDETVLWVIGNLPIIILSVLALIKNQQMLIEETKTFEIAKLNDLQKAAWNILQLNPLLKFPIIFVLCLPVIVVITGVLLLFGQKPDSLIRTFTETYHHGLSQWNYKCDNVECGGHYLCSVAAKGHKKIVKPQRFGVRNGGTIICNRQLLVSNAFEELLQERLPKFHRIIRKQYNKVGSLIHRHYYIFDNKIISDAVYIMMKPLEWFFLLTLYLFDRKPENRIAIQYLSINERKQLKEKLSS